MLIIDHFNNKSVTCDLANLTFIMVIMETIVQEMNALDLFLCAPCHSPNISGPVHTTLPRRNFKIQLSFWRFLRKTGSEKSHDCRDVIIFEMLLFQNVFPPYGIEYPGFFFNFSRLKSAFEKLRFRDGLLVRRQLTKNWFSLNILSRSRQHGLKSSPCHPD